MKVIDRFEGEYAVILDDDTEEVTHVRRSELPLFSAEGDCLREADDGSYITDREETERRRAEINKKLRYLND